MAGVGLVGCVGLVTSDAPLVAFKVQGPQSKTRYVEKLIIREEEVRDRKSNWGRHGR